MTMTGKLNREELAALEVGHTKVSRSLAKSIVFCFILLIVSVPVLQEILGSKNQGQQSLLSSLQVLVRGQNRPNSESLKFPYSLMQKNNELLERMDVFEKQLEEESFLRAQLLAPGQRLLLAMGYGNEKVYPGKSHWLFYRPDMDYLMGPGFLDPHQLQKRRDGGKVWEKSLQPDPVQTILHFQSKLAERGIRLILVPTPIKASLHPEFFSSATDCRPLQNKSWTEFIDKMEQSGVVVFDPAPIIAEYQQQKKAPVYLETDTHWNPEAMEKVAGKLADLIETSVSLSSDKGIQLKQQEKNVRNRGDIDNMLRIPGEWELYAEEEVLLQQIVTHGDELWQSDPDAEILLLGDSFSNIYSLAGMGWGEGAGFGEQLSFHLQKQVDVILQNDAGAFATRELLAKELGRGRDRLSGKKVLVWQFASRELASGDWRAIPMELGESLESDFYTPQPGEKRDVTAVVASISRSPVPGSVPYKDNILTLHLVDIQDNVTGEKYGQALVYGWGMQENKLAPLAKARAGQQIEITLVDWDTVQGDYSSYRRSTLDDEMLELELPVWGEIKP